MKETASKNNVQSLKGVDQLPPLLFLLASHQQGTHNAAMVKLGQSNPTRSQMKRVVPSLKEIAQSLHTSQRNTSFLPESEDGVLL
jgi:hypothetical protein